MSESKNAIDFLNRLKSLLRIEKDTDLAAFLGVKQNTISGWKSRNAVDYTLIMSKCDRLDWNYLLFGRVSSFADQNELYKKKEQKISQIENERDDKTEWSNIAMLDIPAAAGLPYHVGEARFFDDLPMIQWPGETFKHGIHIAIQITGDSMEPVLFSGEWVICKKLDDAKRQIRNGNIYVVVTNDGVVAKRLYNTVIESGSITLQSDNPIYLPYQQPIEEVLQVYEAKGKISLNLNAIQNEVKNRLNTIEYKIDQLVSKLT